MTIWLLAFLVLAAVALAGWRQGAIRAAFSFVGILFATWLAVPLGRIFQPLLPHLGAHNPILAWALAPLVGFILVSILFVIAGFMVHRRVEVFYKYRGGDLRLALWTRLNTRLGICLGLLNGSAYFILISFVIFNLSYWTSQVAPAAPQAFLIRAVNQLGRDLQSTGLNRAATAVGTPPAMYYQLADLSGLLMQNPQVGERLVEYPGLTSLWERDDMQPLVQDSVLTNALASGATLGDIFNSESVQGFLANKDLTRLVLGVLETNIDDLSAYLTTGKSAHYNDNILGRWELNIGVTIAWLRQSQPRIQASEMRSVRTWMTQAYAQTVLLAAGDNQLFAKNLPRLKAQTGQPAATEFNNWKGDWSHNDTNYDLHLSFNGEDKYMSASTDGLRLSVRDGKNLLIFDQAD